MATGSDLPEQFNQLRNVFSVMIDYEMLIIRFRSKKTDLYPEKQEEIWDWTKKWIQSDTALKTYWQLYERNPRELFLDSQFQAAILFTEENIEKLIELYGNARQLLALYLAKTRQEQDTIKEQERKDSLQAAVIPVTTGLQATQQPEASSGNSIREKSALAAQLLKKMDATEVVAIQRQINSARGRIYTLSSAEALAIEPNDLDTLLSVVGIRNLKASHRDKLEEIFKSELLAPFMAYRKGLEGTTNFRTRLSSLSNATAPLVGSDIRTAGDFMENAFFRTNFENFALASSFLQLDDAKIKSQLEKNLLVFAQNNPEFLQALRADTKGMLESQFYELFKEKVSGFRSEVALKSGGKVYTWADSQNEDQVVTAITQMAGTKLGTSGTILMLTKSRDRNLQEAKEKVKKYDSRIKSTLSEIERAEYEEARMQSYIVDVVQPSVSTGVFRRFGLDSAKPFADQLFSSRQITTEEANGSLPPSLSDSDVGVRSSSQSPKDRQKTLRSLQSTAQFARTMTTNPLGMAALGALGGGVYGLVTQGVSGMIGAGLFGGGGALAGAWAGAQIGGAIGSLVGPVGTFIGGAVGGIAGGIGGGFGGVYGSTHLQLAGGQSVAQGLGNTILGIGNTATSSAFQQTITAAGQGALSNAALSGSGIGSNLAAGAANAAGSGMSSFSSMLNALPTAQGALSQLVTAGTTVMVPIATGTLITVFVATSINTAFLVSDQVSPQESKYVTLKKVPNPTYAEDPTSVTYVIEVKPKEPYKITITGVKDTIAFTKNGTAPTPKSAPQETLDQLKGVLPKEGKTITYMIDYGSGNGSEYDDTRITNTINLEYEAEDSTGTEPKANDSFSVNATVSFGEPPAVACWPTIGNITNVPFSSANCPSGNCTHANVDSVDIAKTGDVEIIAPYSGTIEYRAQSEFSSCQGQTSCWWNAGNFAILHADIGYDFLFQHMRDAKSQSAQPISAGDQIGYQGSTGFVTGQHLHYEVRRTWNVPPDWKPNSVLKTLVPSEPSIDTTGGTITQENRCAGASPGETLIREGCFVFTDGSKKWTPDEITKVRTVLREEVLSDAKIKSLVCTNKGTAQDISLVRISDPCSDPNAGNWSGYTSTSKIEFCDNLFPQGNASFNRYTFGRSTLMHEPSHIIQFRRNQPWSSYMTDEEKALFHDRNRFYTDTYPYKYENESPPRTGAVLEESIFQENIGEAFGLCRALALNNTDGYRNKYINQSEEGLRKYAKECAAITRIIGQMTP